MKQLRNTYPLGKKAMQELMSFLASRGRTLPEGGMEDAVNVYFTRTEKEDGKETERIYAKYYDALEMADMYIPLQDIKSK